MELLTRSSAFPNKNCIINILQRFYHTLPRKLQHYPHPRNEIALGSILQIWVHQQN